MYVGCGRCGACKHNKRVDWTFRIMQEAKASKSCFFITLTYCDSVIPYTENWLQTLRKKDVQLFNKKVRKLQSEKTETKVRFFCVGEYGSKYLRPHYHIIYFNLLPDLADPAELIPIWNKGIVHQYSIADGLIHYTTKYHVTANNQYRHLDPKDDRLNEFVMMSLKPPKGSKIGGIGYQYIKLNKQMHLNSKTAYVRNNGFIMKMPKYYHQKIFGDLPAEEKEELRLEGELRAEQAYDREILKLMKLGYDDPVSELLSRQVYAAKQVRIKANKKGIF